MALVAHGPLILVGVPAWLWRALLPRNYISALSDELVVPIEFDVEFVGAPSSPPSEPQGSAAWDLGEEEAAVRSKITQDASERHRKDEEANAALARERANRDEEQQRLKLSAAGPTTSSATTRLATPAVGSELPPKDAASDYAGDPARRAGGLAQAQANDTYVKIYIATDLIRRQEFGSRIGEFLARVPQWDELLGGTGLDPIQHFDHLLLTGPHMQTSRVVVAVGGYNVSSTRMRDAVERAMKSSTPPGEWLSTEAGRVGSLGPGQAQVVLIREGTKIVIVGPAALRPRFADIPNEAFPLSTDVVLHLTLANPWRPLARFGITLPPTLSSIEITISQRDRRFLVELVAPDESSETAVRTGDALVRILEEVRDNPIPFAADWFNRPRVTVKGNVIHAEALLTISEIRALLVAAEVMLPSADTTAQ